MEKWGNLGLPFWREEWRVKSEEGRFYRVYDFNFWLGKGLLCQFWIVNYEFWFGPCQGENETILLTENITYRHVGKSPYLIKMSERCDFQKAFVWFFSRTAPIWKGPFSGCQKLTFCYEFSSFAYTLLPPIPHSWGIGRYYTEPLFITSNHRHLGKKTGKLFL